MTIKFEGEHASTGEFITEKPGAPYSWPDELWRSSFLPIGTATRLARIDRALQGATTILRILSLASHCRFGESGLHDQRHVLSHNDTDGLHFALGVLHESATDAIEQLRDNLYDCCRGAPALHCTRDAAPHPQT